MRKKVKRKILIGMIIILSLLSIYAIVMPKNIDKKLENYLINKGFKYENNSYLLSKSNPSNSLKCKSNTPGNCKSEIDYFDFNNYKLIRNNNINDNNVFYELTFTNNYITKIVTYKYRISYINGVIILTGEYEPSRTNKCTLEYIYGLNLKDYNTLCNSLNNYLLKFYYDAENLIQSSSILKEIRK